MVQGLEQSLGPIIAQELLYRGRVIYLLVAQLLPLLLRRLGSCHVRLIQIAERGSAVMWDIVGLVPPRPLPQPRWLSLWGYN